MLRDADTNLVIHAEKQQKMPPRISTLQICLTQKDNHYQVVCHHPPEVTRRDNHYQVVCHHPPEALIQFQEPAAPFKMDKLDPQIPLGLL